MNSFPFPLLLLFFGDTSLPSLRLVHFNLQFEVPSDFRFSGFRKSMTSPLRSPRPFFFCWPFPPCVPVRLLHSQSSFFLAPSSAGFFFFYFLYLPVLTEQSLSLPVWFLGSPGGHVFFLSRSRLFPAPLATALFHSLPRARTSASVKTGQFSLLRVLGILELYLFRSPIDQSQSPFFLPIPLCDKRESRALSSPR